jgi:hypothetical protein
LKIGEEADAVCLLDVLEAFDLKLFVKHLTHFVFYLGNLVIFHILKQKRLPLLEVLFLCLCYVGWTLFKQLIVTVVHVFKIVKFERRFCLRPIGLLQALVQLRVKWLVLLGLRIIVLVPHDAVLLFHFREEFFNTLVHIFVLKETYV